MLERLQLKSRFMLILAAMTLGFVAFALITTMAVERLRVGGPVFKKIDLANTLIADILPPPAYIIESHLVANKLANAAPDDVKNFVERFERLKAEYEARHDFWIAAELPERLKNELAVESYESATAYYQLAISSFIPAVKSRDLQGAASALAKMDVLYESHRAHIDEAVTLAQAFSVAQQQYAKDALTGSAVQLAIVFLASLIAGLTLTALVMRSLSRQLGGEPQYALLITNTVAEGDLSTQVVTHAKDTGSVLHAMRRMTDQLSTIVRSIRSDANELAASAESLSSGAEQVKKATYAQSEAASSTAAAVQQVTVSISSVAQNSDEVRVQAQASLKETELASQSLGKLATDMRGVEWAVDAIETAVNGFVQRANEITAMTRQVKDIADQTNLLALNASIEAARAGEQGRGFAVVADEVRKLAEKSGSSANQIDSATKAMSDQSQKVELAFTAGKKSLASSLDHVKDVTQLLDRAKSAVAEAVRGVGDIAASVGEQSVASNEIARNIEKIAQMAEHNQSISEDATESAQKFVGLSAGLLATVKKFRMAG